MDIKLEAVAKAVVIADMLAAANAAGTYARCVSVETVAICCHGRWVFGIIFRFALYEICGFVIVVVSIVVFVIVLLIFVVIATFAVAAAVAVALAALSAVSHNKAMAMMPMPAIQL